MGWEEGDGREGLTGDKVWGGARALVKRKEEEEAWARDSIPWLSYFLLPWRCFLVLFGRTGRTSETNGLSYHWESWLAFSFFSLELLWRTRYARHLQLLLPSCKPLKKVPLCVLLPAHVTYYSCTPLFPFPFGYQRRSGGLLYLGTRLSQRC